jgi:hypothetical protein
MPAKAKSPAKKGPLLLELKAQMTMLEDQGSFHEWSESLANVVYFAGWSNKLIDIEQEEKAPWDGEEPVDKEEKQHRLLAYALVRMTIGPNLNHLKTGSLQGTSKVYIKMFITDTADSPLEPFNH